MHKKPKLRGQKPRRNAPHALSELHYSQIEALAKLFVHRMAVGHADITGDDFGGIFADAISGEHRGSPLGLSDVTWENCGWSVKTVQADNPFEVDHIRVISGRNDIDYSFDVVDYTQDVQKTGRLVLEIWNSRVDESLAELDELRSVVLVRNFNTMQFVIFEEEVNRFKPHDYLWSTNKNGNFIGTEIATGFQKFTWQKGGKQFTIHKKIPSSAQKFSLTQRPKMIEAQHIIDLTGFTSDWVKIET